MGNSFEKFTYTPAVEKPKKPEEYYDILFRKILSASFKVNQEYKGLLNPDGKLSMVGSTVEEDLAKIELRESNWADGQGKTVEQWQKDKEKNPSTIAEMAIHATLHKQFGSDFIVARASEYDDFVHGVDNVLIDKKTGAVVCGFDDVLGKDGDDGGNKKSAKIHKNWQNKGTILNYGATVNKQGELIRKKLYNLPNFYLSISKENLMELLAEMKDKTSDGSVALALCNKMIRSLEEQSAELASMENIDPRLMANTKKFEESLGRMKGMMEK